MGGGKTTQTVQHLDTECQQRDKTFKWMTLNIAIADNTYARMGHFKNMALYITEKRKEKKQEMIEKSENLMICMNSLTYAKRDYNVVVIDEIKSFLKKWCFNETLQGVQEICYENFVRILRKADKVIVMDVHLLLKFP